MDTPCCAAAVLSARPDEIFEIGDSECGLHRAFGGVLQEQDKVAGAICRLSDRYFSSHAF